MQLLCLMTQSQQFYSLVEEGVIVKISKRLDYSSNQIKLANHRE